MLYKKSEIFLHWLFKKLEKLHFEPTLDLFWSKNFKTELFAEKTIYNNFKFLCHSSLCKNSEMFHVLIFDTIRTSKTSKQDFSPKKSSTLILSIHATVILCKKREKLWVPLSHKTFILSSFWPKNLSVRFFP